MRCVFLDDGCADRIRKSWLFQIEIKQPMDYWGRLMHRSNELSGWSGPLPLITRQEFVDFAINGAATQQWVAGLYDSAPPR